MAINDPGQITHRQAYFIKDLKEQLGEKVFWDDIKTWTKEQGSSEIEKLQTKLERQDGQG